MAEKLERGKVVGQRVGTCEMCQYPNRQLLEHVSYWANQARHRNAIDAFCRDCYRREFAENDQVATWAAVDAVVA